MWGKRDTYFGSNYRSSQAQQQSSDTDDDEFMVESEDYGLQENTASISSRANRTGNHQSCTVTSSSEPIMTSQQQNRNASPRQFPIPMNACMPPYFVMPSMVPVWPLGMLVQRAPAVRSAPTKTKHIPTAKSCPTCTSRPIGQCTSPIRREHSAQKPTLTRQELEDDVHWSPSSSSEDEGIQWTHTFSNSSPRPRGRPFERQVPCQGMRQEPESSWKHSHTPSRRVQNLHNEVNQMIMEARNKSDRPRLSGVEPSHKRPRRVQCPVEGCFMDVGRRLHQHLQTHHIPGLFHQGETIQELNSPQFQAMRRHALEMITKFLLGRGAQVQDLVEYVNSRMTHEKTLVSPEESKSMEALALASNWQRPRLWSVDPVNSQAALIHYRPLSFLMSKLQYQDRQEIFQLFGQRWELQKLEAKKKKRNRPNPKRRRWLKEAHDASRPLSDREEFQKYSRPSEREDYTRESQLSTRRDFLSPRGTKAVN